MPITTHNIYENVRTRVVVVHDGRMLLLPPGTNEPDCWSPPGGGLEPHESLAECARREVLEETGVAVTIGRVAFLREWVAPARCTLAECDAEKGEFGFGV
jgi:ADP-ribose pyrophosphatase YjhB (NUDIX family)